MINGILWLTLPEQVPPVQPLFEVPPKHYHVTLQFNTGLTLEIQKLLGKEVEVHVVSNCHNDSIQALLVSLPEDIKGLCKNENPYMTVSMVEGVRPVESNNMLAENHISEPLSLTMRLRIDFFQFS